MSITILNPGMLTSVQDLGRIGYQQYGVSVSGVIHAARPSPTFSSATTRARPYSNVP